MSEIVVQVFRSFYHVYPLPLSAVGVALNLNSKTRERWRDYARCEVYGYAIVTRVLERRGTVDVWIEILRCDAGVTELYGFNAGDAIVIPFNLKDDPAMMAASNLLQLVHACCVDLDTMTSYHDFVGKHFKLSIPIPCA